MNLKIPIFALFAILLLTNPAFSQIDSTRFMDYKTFPKEMAVDFIPVLGGSNPSSIFYRKTNQREDAGPTAFRLQFNFFNNFSYGPDDNSTALNNNYLNVYGIQMGKEWLKPLNERMLAYSGFDLGFGFGSVTNRSSGPRNSPNIYSKTFSTFNYSATILFGVKYHLHQRISASAEMGIQPNFQRSLEVTQFGSFNAGDKIRETSDAFGLRLLPLNALRLSYHF